jgi:hypothetical protein
MARLVRELVRVGVLGALAHLIRRSEKELVKIHRVHKYIVPDQRRNRAWFDMHRDTLLRMFVLGIVFLVVVMVIMVLFIVRILIGG